MCEPRSETTAIVLHPRADRAKGYASGSPHSWLLARFRSSVEIVHVAALHIKAAQGDEDRRALHRARPQRARRFVATTEARSATSRDAHRHRILSRRLPPLSDVRVLVAAFVLGCEIQMGDRASCNVIAQKVVRKSI